MNKEAGFMEKKSVKLPNGETCAYIDEGKGETLLLLHGNQSSSLHFLPLFSRLANVRLVAPDLRGFGDSSYNKPVSSLAEFAEDVKLFVDALGISRAHVTGWSTGGGIAFELAVKYPALVSSIFVIEGVGYKGYPLLKKNADESFSPFKNKEEMALDPVVLEPALAAYKNQDFAFFDQVWDTAIYLFKKPSAEDNRLYITETLKQRNILDVDWALAAFNMSGEHNGYTMGSGTIGKINCPVAITCGEKDIIVPPETSRENARAIRGAKLLEYEGCGHSPMVDCPDRLAADILALTAL
jgi:pimeloyl-ACP methyl ester carboxylesterase